MQLIEVLAAFIVVVLIGVVFTAAYVPDFADSLAIYLASILASRAAAVRAHRSVYANTRRMAIRLEPQIEQNQTTNGVSDPASQS